MRKKTTNIKQEEYKMSENKMNAEIKSNIGASLKYAKTVTVEGVDYTLQKLPTRPALEIRGRCKSGADFDDLKMYEEMLEHVVVHPKMKVDDFKDVATLEDLMKQVLDYQYKTKGK